MPVQVKLHVVFLKQRHESTDVFGLGGMDTLATNRQVAHNDLPAGGLGQFSFDPCPLGCSLPLGLGTKITAIPQRAQRAGVEYDYAHILDGKMVGVVAGWHDPAAFGFCSVVDFRLGGRIVIVVTQGSNPRHLQRRRIVNLLKRIGPTGIIGRLHAVRIKVIPRGHDSRNRLLRRLLGHRFRHGPLQIGVLPHQGILTFEVRVGPAPIA